MALVHSMNQIGVNNLLDRSMPSYRQAYSDRTAWLMACLSELAYIRFNPLFSNDNHKKWFRDHVSRLVDDNRKKSLDVLIDLVGYDHEAERKRLESALGDLRFQLSATFDCGGTQAILVSNDKFLVLAFRGTEATSVKDIKADARAKKTPCETGGGIHTALQDAKIAISKGAWCDNSFVERLWRTIKYEEVYLRAYRSRTEARRGLDRYLAFYNRCRPHSSLGGQPPDQVSFNQPMPSPAAA